LNSNLKLGNKYSKKIWLIVILHYLKKKKKKNSDFVLLVKRTASSNRIGYWDEGKISYLNNMINFCTLFLFKQWPVHIN